MIRSISLLALAVALVPLPPGAGSRQDAPADGTLPADAAQRSDDDHHDHGDEIVVTGVRRQGRRRARRHVGARRRRAGQAIAAEHRRDAGAAARRLRHQLRPDRLAADPARPVGRSDPGPDRRHRQLRRFRLEPRPCRRDQSADRRADRGAARPFGAAVRIVGDRRRGQCHRPANPARRAGGRGRRRRLARIWHCRQRALGQPVGRCRRSVSHFVIHADGNWSKSDDLRDRRAYPDQGAARAGGRQPRSRRSRSWPTSRASCPTPPPRRWEVAGGVAYVDGDAQRRRVGHAITTRSTAFRSAISLDPDDRGRGADDRRQADPLRRPRRNPADRLLQPGSRPRRLRQISPSRDRGHRRDRLDLPHQGRRGPRSSWSRPSRTAGAGPAASNISTARSSIDGEEKFLPDEQAEAVRPVHDAEPGPRTAAPGRRRSRRVQQADGRGRRGSRHSGNEARLHHLFRLGRRRL